MAKVPHPLFPIALSILAASCTAAAQNSDLGLLLGVIDSPTVKVSGTPAYVSTSAGVEFQINYAYQLKGWRAGDLYLEVPFILAVRGETAVQGYGASSVTSSGIGAFVPGVRFKLPLGGRASLYAAGGAGIGWFGANQVVSSTNQSLVQTNVSATAAFDFGGGLDLRLTRLLSLRGEARDLITSHRSFSNSGGHNNPIYDFGFAFHF